MRRSFLKKATAWMFFVLLVFPLFGFSKEIILSPQEQTLIRRFKDTLSLSDKDNREIIFSLNIYVNRENIYRFGEIGKELDNAVLTYLRVAIQGNMLRYYLVDFSIKNAIVVTRLSLEWGETATAIDIEEKIEEYLENTSLSVFLGYLSDNYSLLPKTKTKIGGGYMYVNYGSNKRWEKEKLEYVIFLREISLNSYETRIIFISPSFVPVPPSSNSLRKGGIHNYSSSDIPPFLALFSGILQKKDGRWVWTNGPYFDYTTEGNIQSFGFDENLVGLKIKDLLPSKWKLVWSIASKPVKSLDIKDKLRKVFSYTKTLIDIGTDLSYSVKDKANTFSQDVIEKSRKTFNELNKRIQRLLYLLSSSPSSPPQPLSSPPPPSSPPQSLSSLPPSSSPPLSSSPPQPVFPPSSHSSPQPEPSPLSFSPSPPLPSSPQPDSLPPPSSQPLPSHLPSISLLGPGLVAQAGKTKTEGKREEQKEEKKKDRSAKTKETPKEKNKKKQEQQTQEKKTKSRKQKESTPQPCPLPSFPSPVSTKTVIFSEIAWAGTVKNPRAEWIELYNLLPYPVKLKDWRIQDKKGDIFIPFGPQDLINPGQYYLLERTSDKTLPTLKADKIYKGTLSNRDEALYLFSPDCILQDYVSTTQNKGWAYGTSKKEERRTMERGDNFSWHTYYLTDPFLSSPFPVYGTPKAPNSKPPPTLFLSKTPPPPKRSRPTPSFSPLSVVISELSWSGTKASPHDEWIELYNNTDKTINLTGWTIQAKDKKPTIQLSGTISPRSFFLLERTDDTTLPTLPADLTYTGALSNKGETLYLKDPQGNIIDTLSFSSNWPAGQNTPEKRSMERKNTRNLGTDSSNWQTYPGSGLSTLTDSQNYKVLGTPRSPNYSSFTLPSSLSSLPFTPQPFQPLTSSFPLLSLTPQTYSHPLTQNPNFSINSFLSYPSFFLLLSSPLSFSQTSFLVPDPQNPSSFPLFEKPLPSFFSRSLPTSSDTFLLFSSSATAPSHLYSFSSHTLTPISFSSVSFSPSSSFPSTLPSFFPLFTLSSDTLYLVSACSTLSQNSPLLFALQKDKVLWAFDLFSQTLSLSSPVSLSSLSCDTNFTLQTSPLSLFYSSPNSTLYLTFQNKLFLLDPQTGSLLSSFTLPFPDPYLLYSPPYSPNLLFLSSRYNLALLDLSTSPPATVFSLTYPSNFSSFHTLYLFSPDPQTLLVLKEHHLILYDLSAPSSPSLLSSLYIPYSDFLGAPLFSTNSPNLLLPTYSTTSGSFVHLLSFSSKTLSLSTTFSLQDLSYPYTCTEQQKTLYCLFAGGLVSFQKTP